MKLIYCLVNICYDTFPYNNASRHLSVRICTHYRCFVFVNITVLVSTNEHFDSYSFYINRKLKSIIAPNKNER